MRASDLRHRITIEVNKGTGRNNHNEPIPIWEPFKKVWGTVEWLSGREFWAAQQINSEINGKVTLRYTKGVKASMRVKYEDRLFDIISVIPDEQKKKLELLVKELL